MAEWLSNLASEATTALNKLDRVAGDTLQAEARAEARRTVAFSRPPPPYVPTPPPPRPARSALTAGIANAARRRW